MRKCVKRQLLLKTIAKENFVLRCVFRISDEECWKGKTSWSCMEWGWCCVCVWWHSLRLIRPDYNRDKTLLVLVCLWHLFEMRSQRMRILTWWDILTWILTLSIFEWMFLEIPEDFFFFYTFRLSNGCRGRTGSLIFMIIKYVVMNQFSYL